jgi:murein DD-endopeptidase MepM/ murein hydrolase activator NlpD
MEQENNKNSFLESLRQRFRLVLLHEQSYEELFSTSISRFQLWLSLLTLLLFIAGLTTAIIAYTPLKEYIPGYSPKHLSRDLIDLSFRTDSLEYELRLKDQKMFIIEKILKGEAFDDSSLLDNNADIEIQLDALNASVEDSIFRVQVEREDRFNVLSEDTGKPVSLRNTVFYAPIKGLITSSFSLSDKHYGVDVVAPENEAIKATLPGTVVFANWTSDTGYVLAIQHENNLFSLYKHNSVLLKKEGDLVQAGEVIAIIGNSGELSTGPHLHFELWHQGKAINPEHHILF